MDERAPPAAGEGGPPNVPPGSYIMAAQAAREAFVTAPSVRRYGALSAWEECAYAMRTVGSGTPHPSVVGILDAITTALEEEPLDDLQRGMLRARRMRHYCWDRPAEFRAQAQAEVEAARRIGALEPLVYALFALHTGVERPTELQRALQLSAELVGVAERHLSPVIRAMGHWRRYIDCLVVADSAGRDAHLGALIRACEETGDRYWEMVATMCRADHEISGGNYRRGEELLATLRGGVGDPGAIWPWWPRRSTVLEFPGLLTAAVSTLSISRAATGARALHPAFRIGLAYTLALSGRTTEAAAELEGIDLDSVSRDGGYLPCLAMVIDLAIDHFRDSVVAEDAYRRLLPHAGLLVVTGPGQGTWGPATLYLGRGAIFLGLPVAADHLRQARATAAAMRMRPALALALLELGRLERGRGDATGVAMIEEALSIAELIGFVPAATRARAALRAGPERRRAAATTALSQREREVLALVARGHTAAEVAEQLVLSRRTVEKHLEHAYTKIGARNRAEGINWAIVNGLTQDP